MFDPRPRYVAVGIRILDRLTGEMGSEIESTDEVNVEVATQFAEHLNRMWETFPDRHPERYAELVGLKNS